MRKKIQQVIHHEIKRSLLDYLLFVVQCVLLVSLGILVGYNIAASQSIDKLYSNLFSPSVTRSENDNRVAMIHFLKKIQYTDEFPRYFTIAKNMYGDDIEKDIFSESYAREDRIKTLENILKKNPKARDVLITLSYLYKENGQLVKAKLYMDQAKAIDPGVK